MGQAENPGVVKILPVEDTEFSVEIVAVEEAETAVEIVPEKEAETLRPPFPTKGASSEAGLAPPNYRDAYFEKFGFDTLKNQYRSGKVQPGSDLLGYVALADVVSVPLHNLNQGAVLFVHGERGVGKTTMLDLVWQALERRQACAHAEERPRRISRFTDMCGRWLGLACWRFACYGFVDFSANTLTGYYIRCPIQATELLGNDRVWGTLINAAWKSIDGTYGPWQRYWFRLAPKIGRKYPRAGGPIFWLLFRFLLLLLLIFAAIIAGLYILSLFISDITITEAAVGRFVKSTTSQISGLVVSALALMFVFAGIYYVCKSDPAKTERTDAEAKEENRWAVDSSGYHAKVRADIANICAMLEVHVRVRNSWLRLLRLFIPWWLDGFLPDGLFACYAWPELVFLIDDLDKVPSTMVVRLFEAIEMLKIARGKHRDACPFKFVMACDPWILDRALGHYYSGAASAYPLGGMDNGLLANGIDSQRHSAAELESVASVVAAGQRYIRAFVDVPVVLPRAELAETHRAELSGKFLHSLGMVATSQPEPPKPKVFSTNPPTVPPSFCRKLWCPRHAHPQHFAQRSWRKGASQRAEFGPELFEGDAALFAKVARYLPANAKSLRRVSVVFGCAQRLRRVRDFHAECDVAADPSWRSKLLRWVLVAERWPFRASLLRHVILNHDDAAAAAARETARLTDVLHDQVELIDCAMVAPLVALDDSAVVLESFLGADDDPLTLADVADLDSLVLNKSPSVERHIAVVADFHSASRFADIDETKIEIESQRITASSSSWGRRITAPL